MTALPLVITRAGLAAHAAAQLDGALSLKVARVGFTDAVFVPAPTLTALPGEHRRLDTVSGAVVGDNTVHLTIRDDVGVGYGVRGFALILDDGTLFAVYGQADRIVEKSAEVALFLALDVAFPIGNVETLSFGNTSFLLPGATTTTKGLVELATQAEADAGTAGPLAITAALLARAVAALRAYVDAAIATTRGYVDSSIAAFGTSAGQAIDGLASRTVYGAGLVTGGGRNDTNRTLTVQAATSAEMHAGTQSDVVVTPAALATAGFAYVVRSHLAAQAGYREWSDGFIEQWGYVDGNITNEQAFAIAFPIPFAVECFGISGTARNTSQSTSGSHQVQEVSVGLTGATVFLQSDQSTTADAAGGFRWFARGR